MTKLRILVVDDAVVIRRVLTEALAEDLGLEVVATAPNGKIALDKIARLLPDLVVLDLEMPEMDGMQTLAELRTRHPALPVIVFSGLTARSTAAEARAAGASDFIFKPEIRGGADGAHAVVREQLIPSIKRHAARRSPSATHSADSRPAPPTTLAGSLAALSPFAPVDVLAIGVSTGGPNALAQLLTQFPAPFPVPVVIVQHMPPEFTHHLARRLDGLAALRVREAVDGDALEPGHALIAPGDFHMVLESRASGVCARLLRTPPENSCRPSVDVLFRSVASAYGARSLAVVLTGMGKDGLRGCESICGAGGHVLVQDQESSVIWGMPGAVARAGLAERILSLDQLGPEILQRVRQRRSFLGAHPGGDSRLTKDGTMTRKTCP